MEQNVAINLNSGETIEVCLPNEVSCGEFEVTFGENATMEIPTALNYIKSGEVEIKKYVNETLVPELNLYESNAKEYAEQAEVSAEKAKESQETAAISEANALASEASAEMFKDLANESAEKAKASEQAVTNLTESAISTINTTKNDAVNELSSILEADKSTLEAYVDSSSTSASVARTWATGTDEEVQAIEDDEHSSRTYANFAMALSNAAEDVPVLESTLLATNVIQGEPWAGGEVTTPLVLVSDDNHPIAIRGMAGASATGYQIVDNNGLGESDFEHYATGDRYGTRISNKNNTSGTTTNIDLYQSNVGISVFDATDVDNVLMPTPDVDDNSQRAATTAWVINFLTEKGLL